MKVIKNINNNVALCVDSAGCELVAFGKGIGFQKAPYELDIARVEKTFYGVGETYARMAADIPDEILQLSDELVTYAGTLISSPLSPNVVFTLADHINFAIERAIKGMEFDLPVAHDVRHFFPSELEVGRRGVALVRERLRIKLPPEEATFIALHIINAESEAHGADRLSAEVIERAVAMVEADLSVRVDRESFSYSRFATHLRYLAKRVKEPEASPMGSEELYRSLHEAYPKVFDCVQHIRRYLGATLGWDLTDEECVYLILHVQRLTSRESSR